MSALTPEQRAEGGWIVAPVVLKVASEHGPTDHIVAGWVNGPFGLDFRTFLGVNGESHTPGFMITHLPTGLVVRALIGVGMEEAKRLADEILTSADWLHPKTPTPEQSAATKAFIDRHPRVVTSAGRNWAPRA